MDRGESTFWSRTLTGTALLSLLGCAALVIDVPLARWCLADNVPGSVQKALHLSESFGHGFGASLILLTVLVLDPASRWALPRLALASLGAGAMANFGKLLVARARPHHFDFAGGARETFLGWLPLGGPSYEQGFPSSHTATAVGLAVGLAWLYPRGRVWFAILAALVAFQRIETGAHFLSDTLWGAAWGYLVARTVIWLPSLGYLGNKLERWLRGLSGLAGIHSPQSSESSRRCAIASSISGTAAPRTRP